MAEIDTSNRILNSMVSRDVTENKSSGRSYGCQTLDARRQQRKAQLLWAGLNVFGTTGFRSATVCSLCKEAKRTSRYFYDSFENLEDLVIALYEDCMQKLGKQVVGISFVGGHAADGHRMVVGRL